MSDEADTLDESATESAGEDEAATDSRAEPATESAGDPDAESVVGTH
jgi:hypothetical protein